MLKAELLEESKVYQRLLGGGWTGAEQVTESFLVDFLEYMTKVMSKVRYLKNSTKNIKPGRHPAAEAEDAQYLDFLLLYFVVDNIEDPIDVSQLFWSLYDATVEE